MKVKTGWQEVTLKEFIEISDIEQDEKLMNTLVAKKVKLISVISSGSYEELLEADGDTLEELVNATGFLHELPDAHSEETFKLNGVEYMTIPDLNQLTVGENISLEQILLRAKAGDNNIIVDLLPILIRPVVRTVDPEFPDKIKVGVEKFDETKLADRRELFLRELTVPFFMTCLNNITSGKSTLEGVFQSYSKKVSPLKGKKK